MWGSSWGGEDTESGRNIKSTGYNNDGVKRSVRVKLIGTLNIRVGVEVRVRVRVGHATPRTKIKTMVGCNLPGCRFIRHFLCSLDRFGLLLCLFSRVLFCFFSRFFFRFFCCCVLLCFFICMFFCFFICMLLRFSCILGGVFRSSIIFLFLLGSRCFIFFQL